MGIDEIVVPNYHKVIEKNYVAYKCVEDLYFGSVATRSYLPTFNVQTTLCPVFRTNCIQLNVRSYVRYQVNIQ